MGAPHRALAAQPVELTGGGAAGHADDLGDRDDPAAAVGPAGLVDDEVDRVGDLLAHRAVREPEAGHEGERLQAAQRLLRRARVDRAQGAVVPGAHRGQHVQGFRPPDLADHDPVGPHAQRVAHQAADRHLAATLDARRARLEAHDVGLAQAQFGGVLDGHDALVGGHERRQRVERRRLARSGPAGDQDVQARADGAGEDVAQRRRPGADGDEVVGAQPARAEATDGEHRPVEGERRDHDVDPRAVRQPRVAQRLGLVDAAPEGREDPLDGMAHVGVGGEADVGALQAPGALDPHRPRAVDHDLVDGRVAEQGLERPEPERALGHTRDELVARAGVQQCRLAVDERADARVQVGAVGRGLGDQPLAQRGGEVVEGGGAGIGVHALTRGASRGFAPGTTEGRDLVVPPLTPGGAV